MCSHELLHLMRKIGYTAVDVQCSVLVVDWQAIAANDPLAAISRSAMTKIRPLKACQSSSFFRIRCDWRARTEHYVKWPNFVVILVVPHTAFSRDKPSWWLKEGWLV